jgi:hypothetical protein
MAVALIARYLLEAELIFEIGMQHFDIPLDRQIVLV